VKHLRRVVGVVCGLGVLACVLACGAATDAFNAGFDLGLINAAYEGCEKANNKPPASAEELEKWASANNQPEKAITAIKETKAGGKYVVKWGTKRVGGAGDAVLAYESKAPASGGVVLMADGNVKTVTADEFGKLNK